MTERGYIQFCCHDQPGPAPSHPALAQLIAARNELFSWGLIGVYPNGIGFGNVSLRGNAFIISGTQTGMLPIISAEQFTLVERYNIEANELWCLGPVKASSESLTHAAVYESQPKAQAVIHFHNRAIWKWGLENLPCTAAHIEAGTVEMAREIQRVVSATNARAIAMAGHEEGMIVWGASVIEALNKVKEVSNAAR